MAGKEVIQTNSSGFFVGYTVADEDQLRPGEFLMPFGAVETPLPQGFDPNQHYARWTGEEWDIQDIPEEPDLPVDPYGNAWPKDRPFDPKVWLAMRRWQVEESGILVAGHPIATDDRSKLLLMGKRMVAEKKPTGKAKWKGKDGKVVEVPHAFLIQAADAVADWVQACFDKEGEILEMIDAGEVSTAAQIDAELAKLNREFFHPQNPDPEKKAKGK